MVPKQSKHLDCSFDNTFSYSCKDNFKEKEIIMKVVKSSPSNISLVELQDHLRLKSGILLWVNPVKPTWRILKGPYQSATDGNNYTYGWVSPYFDRGYDNTDLTISSIEDLVKCISKQSERLGNQFHWFPTRHDFIEWIRKTNSDYDPKG